MVTLEERGIERIGQEASRGPSASDQGASGQGDCSGRVQARGSGLPSQGRLRQGEHGPQSDNGVPDNEDRGVLGGRAMRVRYDEEADALYIRLREGQYDESDEIREGFILDYDADGHIIGIEILEASTELAPMDLGTVNFEINRQLAKPGSRDR